MPFLEEYFVFVNVFFQVLRGPGGALNEIFIRSANSLLQPDKKVRIYTKFRSFYKTLGQSHL